MEHRVGGLVWARGIRHFLVNFSSFINLQLIQSNATKSVSSSAKSNLNAKNLGRKKIQGNFEVFPFLSIYLHVESDEV
jgi:hypothetical protein